MCIAHITEHSNSLLPQLHHLLRLHNTKLLSTPFHLPLLYYSALSSVLGRGMISSFPSGMARKSVVGYRFHPTDKELVIDYLKRKIEGQDEVDRIIPVVNICNYEPWELPDQSKRKSNDPVWYFLSPRAYKYGNSKRFNRTTREGYWKPTGELRRVMAKANKKQIGTKRSLVFYNGRPKGARTGWVMQEYDYVPDTNSKLQCQGNFVLYKLRRKPGENTSKGEPNQCAVVASDFQNQDPSTIAANSVYDEHQPAYHMTIESQCLDEVTTTSSNANAETTHSIPSGFENQTSVLGEDTPPLVIPSNFEYQSPYKKGGCLLTSTLENQITTSREGECTPMETPSYSNQTLDAEGDWLSLSDLENQISACGDGILPAMLKSPYVKGDSLLISGFKNQISVCGDGELPPLVISSDFRSESPHEKGDCLFASDLEDQLSVLTPPLELPFDFENQSIYEKDDCIKTSDLESQVSDMESDEAEQNYPISVLSCFEYPSPLYRGEPNCLPADDFRKICSYDKTNISVSEEGESSNVKVPPSDFENQNQFQKTDMRNLVDFDWDFFMGFNVERAFAEIDAEIMACPAAELQCPRNSEV